MADPHFDIDFASSAVALSGVYGVTRAAEMLDIDRRTLTEYRRTFAERPDRQHLVTEKRKALERDWAENLSGAIAAGIDFLQRAAQEADPKDPDVIYSVAGAVKILTAVAMNKRILDARLLPRSGEVRALLGSGTSEESAEDKLGLQ